MGTKIYHIVNFHADGGQMCVPGRRCFENPRDAHEFAKAMRDEPGHNCGPKSVKQYTADKPLKNEGHVYPTIALSKPPLPIQQSQPNLLTRIVHFLALR